MTQPVEWGKNGLDPQVATGLILSSAPKNRAYDAAQSQPIIQRSFYNLYYNFKRC